MNVIKIIINNLKNRLLLSEIMVGFRLQMPKVSMEILLDLERTLVQTKQELYDLKQSQEIFWKEGEAHKIFEEACEELKSEGIDANLVMIKSKADSQSEKGEQSERCKEIEQDKYGYQSGWSIQLNSEDISDPIFGEIISHQIKLVKSLIQSKWSRFSYDYESLEEKLVQTTNHLINLSTFNPLVEFSSSRERCKIYLYYDQRIHETELDVMTEKFFPLQNSSKLLSYFTKSYISRSTAHNYFGKDHPGVNVFLMANPSKALSAHQLLDYTLNRLIVLYKGGRL